MTMTSLWVFPLEFILKIFFVASHNSCFLSCRWIVRVLRRRNNASKDPGNRERVGRKMSALSSIYVCGNPKDRISIERSRQSIPFTHIAIVAKQFSTGKSCDTIGRRDFECWYWLSLFLGKNRPRYLLIRFCLMVSIHVCICLSLKTCISWRYKFPRNNCVIEWNLSRSLKLLQFMEYIQLTVFFLFHGAGSTRYGYSSKHIPASSVHKK